MFNLLFDIYQTESTLPICDSSSSVSMQVSENAKRDLKEGLVLFNTDNNAGLKNAWNTIQSEV